jgi:DNA-binding transcriptional ArsR family regulator
LSRQLDLVFGALADATRRDILVILRAEGELHAGAIAERFPHVSRVAVSKHLQALLRAELVTVRRDGRRLSYSLHERPLAMAYTEWLRAFVPTWERSLDALKRIVESETTTREDHVRDYPA